MMQVIRIKVHKYLGGALDYNTVGQVKTTILNYIDEILNDFDMSYPTGRGTKSSAAPSIIFNFNEDCKNSMPNKLWSFITCWL